MRYFLFPSFELNSNMVRSTKETLLAGFVLKLVSFTLNQGSTHLSQSVLAPTKILKSRSLRPGPWIKRFVDPSTKRWLYRRGRFGNHKIILTGAHDVITSAIERFEMRIARGITETFIRDSLTALPGRAYPRTFGEIVRETLPFPLGLHCPSWLLFGSAWQIVFPLQ